MLEDIGDHLKIKRLNLEPLFGSDHTSLIQALHNAMKVILIWLINFDSSHFLLLNLILLDKRPFRIPITVSIVPIFQLFCVPWFFKRLLIF